MPARKPRADHGSMKERNPGERATCSEMIRENVQSPVYPNERGNGGGGQIDRPR